MSTIGIVQIHDSIKRGRGHYCSVCFRSKVETRLVKPAHLINLINKLAIRFKGAIQVCVICEALARSAARFIRTLELATHASDLFSNMGAVQWQDVLKHIASPDKYPKVLNNESIPRQALDLDAALREVPRYELRITDTLVVPSLPRRQDMMVVMQHANPPIQYTAIPTLTPSVMAPTMAHMAPALAAMAPALAPMAPALAPMAPALALMAPALAPMAHRQAGPMSAMLSAKSKISVDSELQHVRVMDKDTNQIVLHPMVQGLDGNVYVPSLQLQILDNGLLKSAPNIQNITPATTAHNETLEHPLKIRNETPPQSTPAKQSYSKLQHALQTPARNKTKNKDKSEYYKFLVSRMDEKKQNSNVEIIKMNDLNIVLNVDEGESKKKRKRDEGSMEKTLSEVKLLLSENAQGGCEVKYEIIDDDDATKDKADAASRPVLKTDRTVDWEDKIPMDVISFMDATDPNPEERIMQPPPMGVISDVRSVPNDVTEPIECIDLC